MKKVVVDAFGGDHAPSSVIEGCVMGLEANPDLSVILTGDEETLRSELSKCTYDTGRVSIKHAPDVITNCEAPVQAVRRKKQSSLVVALETVAAKEADVFISAGSTGAVLAGATFIVKRIRGVKRPALAPIMPTLPGGQVVLVDCGANVDCKSSNLQQFAVMGSAYAERVLGVRKPRVGLLNNGAEAEKGCELTKEAYQLLQQTPINFVGNCEGRDVLTGDFDVVVADGFAGNVLLKSIEGTALYGYRCAQGGTYGHLSLPHRGAFVQAGAAPGQKTHELCGIRAGRCFWGLMAGSSRLTAAGNAKAIAATLRQASDFIEGKWWKSFGRALRR